MANSHAYDRERAKRYKKWWARQKGSPQGELIEVAPDRWQRKRGRAADEAATTAEAARAAEGREG